MKIGTAVKIENTITVDGGGEPDSVKITIIDPGGTVRITAASMLGGSGVYTYVFQSVGTWPPGDYEATITAIKDLYTAITQVIIPLEAV